MHQDKTKYIELSVRLLVAGTSSGTSELLGLAATGIGNQQGTVVVDQDVLQLLLRGLIDVCKGRWENCGIRYLYQWLSKG